MTGRIFHPTGGVHTTIKSVKDMGGGRHYVYGEGTFGGRGTKDHQNEPANWQSRQGVDIVCLAGTPVYAAFDGKIGSAFGPLAKHGLDGPDSKFAGNRLTIEGATNSAYYAHLSTFADGLQPGTFVKQGQLIGYTGTAGNVQHLHFAIQNGGTEQLVAAASTHIDPSDGAGTLTPDVAVPQLSDDLTGGAGADLGVDMGSATEITNSPPQDAGVPALERPDSGYPIPPPGGLTAPEWFDPVKASAAVLRIESQLLNLLPVIGMLKGLVETISGQDVLTDDQLGAIDRAINLLPVVGEACQAIVTPLGKVVADARFGGEFSQVLREGAIASGDAAVLVDTLIERLGALRELDRVKDAAAVVDFVESSNRLFDLIDSVADAAGLIGALPSSNLGPENSPTSPWLAPIGGVLGSSEFGIWLPDDGQDRWGPGLLPPDAPGTLSDGGMSLPDDLQSVAPFDRLDDQKSSPEDAQGVSQGDGDSFGQLAGGMSLPEDMQGVSPGDGTSYEQSPDGMILSEDGQCVLQDNEAATGPPSGDVRAPDDGSAVSPQDGAGSNVSLGGMSLWEDAQLGTSDEVASSHPSDAGMTLPEDNQSRQPEDDGSSSAQGGGMSLPVDAQSGQTDSGSASSPPGPSETSAPDDANQIAP